MKPVQLPLALIFILTLTIHAHEGVCCAPNRNYCKSYPCKNNGECVELCDSYVCNCPDGFTGYQCESRMDNCEDGNCYSSKEIDEVNTADDDYCATEPCANDGECINLNNDYKCICRSGFTGKNCEVGNSNCNQNPCKNNATCYNRQNGYRCVCSGNWLGKNCDVPKTVGKTKDYCASEPCENDGECRNRPGGYRCICDTGFSGRRCQIVDYCASKPCKNGGTCISKPNDYECVCSNDWTGEDCSTKSSDGKAAKDYCASEPCQNGGECRNQNEGYKCTCEAGFSGRRCQIVDHCASKPCKNGGTCNSKPTGHECVCTSDWTGEDCGAKSAEAEGATCKVFGIPKPFSVCKYKCTTVTIPLGTCPEGQQCCMGMTTGSFLG